MIDEMLEKEAPQIIKEVKKVSPPKNVSINIPATEEISEEKPKRKPRAKTTKTKLEADPALTQNISMFISAITMGIARITNNPIWQFTPEESLAISDPASRILERMGASEISNKYGDYIALSVALSVAVIPRVILTQQARPNPEEKQQIPPKEVITGAKPKQPKRQAKNSNSKLDEDRTANVTNVIDERLPALAD